MSALTAIKVLELSAGVASEYCGKLLADFGAEVIKVEDPVQGSATRHMGPFAETAPAGPESSGLFAYLNTNKYSVALDVTSAEGSEALNKLIAAVDVVVTDHAGSWLLQHGLDAVTVEQRYPGLVVCAITPYGLSDDEPVPAEDINVIHSSGWGYHTPTGADPSRPPLSGPGRFLVSYESGMEAALCIVASLYDKEASAQGQFIDISKQAVMASRVDYVLDPMIAGDMPVSTDRSAFDLAGPAGIFECKDGYAYIWMSAPAHWEAVAEMMGHPEWMQAFPADWLEKGCTPERVAECRRHLAAFLKTQEKVAISDQAQQLGLTMVPVNNASDLLASPQYQFREFFVELEHPVLGKATYPTVPYRMSTIPTALRSPAPLLGEHTQTQLAALTSGGEQ